ncbi:hypothetical protein BCR42DRAFT_219819 [Absidia repens]|uniref:Uncharacterized protein n=1 Tax=Absidia repens TaxID=90262 RepID=A0A1X2INF9_9FUNG|nr:hypothetical protein BCR42DRAFT_219819 [Absidia repens]
MPCKGHRKRHWLVLFFSQCLVYFFFSPFTSFPHRPPPSPLFFSFFTIYSISFFPFNQCLNMITSSYINR